MNHLGLDKHNILCYNIVKPQVEVKRMRLTEEQAKIVEENHNLIYWYAHLTGISLEEYYDLLAIELCYTVMKWELDKGSLANYFKIRAHGAIYKEYLKTQAKKRRFETVSLDEGMLVCGTAESIENRLDMEKLFDSKFGRLIQLKQDGYSQTEIAKKLGVSQTAISQMLKNLRTQES